MALIKLRTNVNILGFAPDEEFETEDAPHIRGLIRNGYLTELRPIVDKIVNTKKKYTPKLANPDRPAEG